VKPLLIRSSHRDAGTNQCRQPAQSAPPAGNPV